MKKLRDIILFVAMCAATVHVAQGRERQEYNPVVGDVAIVGQTLEERTDSLYLELDIRVHADAMDDCRSWTITPLLQTGNGDYSVTFPEVLINGRKKAQQYRRKLKFENEELLANPPYMMVNSSIKTDTTLKYVMQIPYEMWMDTASLYIRQVLTSCAGEERVFTQKGVESVSLQLREPYRIEPRVNLIRPDREQKNRKMQGQAFLDFQVGRSVIIPSFRRNPEELSKIADIVGKMQNDPDVQIRGLYIEGYASPDGRYSTNERLSRERAIALKDYMRTTFDLPEDIFRVSSVAEDWDGLRMLVEESNIPQKDKVYAIIDSEEDYDRKEQRLRALGGVYRTMGTEIFPQLRRVDYQIDFTVKDYTVEEAQALIGKSPEQLSQRELFMVAETYPTKSKERDEIFDMIFRMYPDDATANINSAAAMLNRDEDNTAKRYLDKAGDDPRAYNNLGVYYLKTGDMDTAEEFFIKAMSAGVEEAAHNLEEVRLKREDNMIMERYNRE